MLATEINFGMWDRAIFQTNKSPNQRPKPSLLSFTVIAKRSFFDDPTLFKTNYTGILPERVRLENNSLARSDTRFFCVDILVSAITAVRRNTHIAHLGN